LSEDFPLPGGLASGTLVAGYRVEEPLGAGGMAVVYRARDERLGRPVALKVLAPALAADAGFRRRFTAESRAAAAVDHPNIIPVYEAGQAGRSLFIAMRLVTGGDLRGVLTREGPLPPARAAQFLSPIASALDAAHRAGLVHRDVKPGNVLVDTDPGRPEHVYLSDFGISKGAASSAGLTGTGEFLGTPDYTSPEQVRGLAADGRADQYALACVTWQLLTGTVPFEREDGIDVLFAHLHEPLPPLDALQPDLPAATGHVLARALAKEPGQRYPSCGEFADALRDALEVPPYRPAVPAAESWHPRSEAAALSAHPATAPAGTGSRPAGPGEPSQATPPGIADAPTQDVDAAPSKRLRPRPGPDVSNPARQDRAGRRRRLHLTVALAGAILAAAAAIALLLTRSSQGPQASTPAAAPTASEKNTEPAASAAPRASTQTASAPTTKPATPSVPLTGTLAAILANPASEGVRTVAFGPRGLLAAGDFSEGSTTYLWDTANRSIIATFTGTSRKPGTQVNAVAFGPGRILAVGAGDGKTYLWNTATGKLTATLIGTGLDVTSAAFGPSGILFTGDDDGCVFLWNTATANSAGSYCTADLAPVDAVAFAPGGTILAMGVGGGKTYRWDTANPSTTIPALTDPNSIQVNSVAFTPDGATLAAGTGNGWIYLWDTATGETTATLTDPGSHGVNSVAFAPDGTTLAVADQNGSTYLWDTVTGKITATLADSASQGVISVAFGPGGTTLAAGDQNGSIYLWHISKGST
jgi:serine/threonine protein kinase/WD40 repeat protein